MKLPQQLTYNPFPELQTAISIFKIQFAVVTKFSPLTVFHMEFSNFILQFHRSEAFPELQTAISIFEIQFAFATKCSPLTVFQKEISNFILQFSRSEVLSQNYKWQFPFLKFSFHIFLVPAI